MKKHIIIIVGFLFLISNFCYAGYKKYQYLDSGQTLTFCLNDQDHYIIASTELNQNTQTRSNIVLIETDTFFNIIQSYEFIENTYNYNYEIRDIIEYSPGSYILCGVYENDSAFIAFVDPGFSIIQINYLSDLRSCNDMAKMFNGAVACGRDYSNKAFVLYFDNTFNQLNILDYWVTDIICPQTIGWESHKISNQTTQAAFSVVGTSFSRDYGFIIKFGFDPSNTLSYIASGIFPNYSNDNSYYGIYVFDDMNFITNSYQSDIIIHKLEQNGFNFIMTDQTYFTGIGDSVFLKDFKAHEYFNNTFAWTGYYYDRGMGNYSGFIATVDNVFVYPLLPPVYSNPQLYSYSSTDISCNFYLNHLEKVFGFSSIGNLSCSYSNSNEIICAHPINSNICNEGINTFNIQPNVISLLQQGTCRQDPFPIITFLSIPFNSTRIFTTDSCFGPGNMNKNNVSLNIDNNFSVEQNQPNPSNQNTVISYSIPENGEVYFKISDISGKVIYQQSINANAGDNNLKIKTNEFRNGIYYYCMEYNGYKIVKKMVIQR